MKKISEIHVTSSTAVSPTPRLVGDLKPTGIIWVPRLGGGPWGRRVRGAPPALLHYVPVLQSVQYRPTLARLPSAVVELNLSAAWRFGPYYNPVLLHVSSYRWTG